MNAAVLPPANRQARRRRARCSTRQPRACRSRATYEVSDYRAKLSLDAISQPSVGVGVDQFGTYAAGGISFLFSDMLGDHMLGATVQSTSRIEDTGASVMYLNRKSRWNWGAVVEHLPYSTGGFAQGVANVDGQDAFVQQTYRVTQLNSGVSAIAHYPFSRVQRVEFSAGVRRIGFDAELETQLFSPITGELFDEQTEELPRPDALNLAEATAALVYDSSIFGATSPLVGRSYRFEYTQMAGSLNYGGVLADYRRYFMPLRPFTFAVRGLHYGRYGGDCRRRADCRRCSLATRASCAATTSARSTPTSATRSICSTCEAFDRLNGSRVAVASAEFRFPLLGLFSRRSFYGPFPIELAFFGDAGMAWTSDTKPSFAGGDRDWVRSAGVALRANVLGYAIAEFDYVRPFDRSRKGWIWQFGLTPGF